MLFPAVTSCDRIVIRYALDGLIYDFNGARILADISNCCLRFVEGEAAFRSKPLRKALKELFFNAEDLLDEGSIVKAVKAYQLALAEAKKDDAEEFQAQNYLGMAFNEADKPKKSIECFRRCQDLALKLYGEDSPELATSLSNEGMVFSHRGEFIAAEDLLERAANILRSGACVSKASRPSRPSLTEPFEGALCAPIEVYANLADCKAKVGKGAEALKWMKCSHAEAKSLLPQGHPTRMQIAMELSNLLAASGKENEATKLAEETFFSMMATDSNAVEAVSLFAKAMVNSAAMLDGLTQATTKPVSQLKSTSKVKPTSKPTASNVVPINSKQRKSPSHQIESGQALQLKIQLDIIKPPIWRRVLVAADCTFAELHRVIQRCMGWGDCHLHEFSVGTTSIGDPLQGNTGVTDERNCRLSDLGVRAGTSFKYVYDFGDDWRHTISVEKSLQKGEYEALNCVLETSGRSPTEDSGGPFVYMQRKLSSKSRKPRKP